MKRLGKRGLYLAAKIGFLSWVEFVAMTSLGMAGTLYVAPNGSDSNPGTLSQPFKTINGAANVAKPGTDVVVRGGTYNGSVYIPLSGVPAGYIRFYPYPGNP